MAAVDSIHRSVVRDVTVAWLIGIARHKLVDHWRRVERDERRLNAIAGELDDHHDDPWDAQLDVMTARDVLGELGAASPSRPDLALRRRPARSPRWPLELGRTTQATEALLVRARRSAVPQTPGRLERGGVRMNPFEQLRIDDATASPATPDPRFASRLRAQLEAALAPVIQLPERPDQDRTPMTDTAHHHGHRPPRPHPDPRAVHRRPRRRRGARRGTPTPSAASRPSGTSATTDASATPR